MFCKNHYILFEQILVGTHTSNMNSWALQLAYCPLGRQLWCGFEDNLRKFQGGDDHRNRFHGHIVDPVSNDEVGAVDVENDRREKEGGSDENEYSNRDGETFEGTVGLAFGGEKDGHPKLEGAAEPNPRSRELGK